MRLILEDLEGRDVEIVGGLVEQEDVGGLEHEAGDEDAGLLAAGEAGDGAIELAGIEEKALGPAGDVNGEVLEDDVVAVGAESLAERLILVELLAGLVEVDHAEGGGAVDGAGIGRDFAGENAEERGLAGAVKAEQSEASAGSEREGEVAEKRPAAEGLGDAVDGDEALGAAVGGGEIDLGGAFGGARFEVAQFAHEAAGVVDAGLGFAGARLGAAAQPFHLARHAVGERFLAVGLGEEELLLLLEEMAVAAFDAEDAVGLGAIDLRHIVDHVVEEVAVVADDDAGEGGVGEELLEPGDAFEIQVVGGFVEEEQVGLADESRGRWRGGASSRRRGLRCAASYRRSRRGRGSG